MLKQFLILGVLSLYPLVACAQNTGGAGMFSPTGFDAYSADVALPVGATVGMAGVSRSGSGTYSVPLDLPPGTNGVLPALSLEYDSHNGPGIAGMGWGVSGISVISRIPKSVYYDGEAEPVNSGPGDRFSLNGKRLISIAGAYGTNGSSYGLEIEDFAVTYIKEMVGNGPKWFESITKDGVRMEFGRTINARFTSEDGSTILYWMLNKIVYPNGNYIDYLYTSDDREPRILKIMYTGNTAAGLNPYNEVRFEYKERNSGSFSDTRTSYIGTTPIVNKWLLSDIKVFAEGAAVRSYRLEYGNNGVNSFLKSIQESGVAETDLLNPTIFQYGDAPPLRVNTTETIPLGDELVSFAVDFNRDGLNDLVTATTNKGNGFEYSSEFKIWAKNKPADGGYSLLATQVLPAATIINGPANVRAQSAPVSLRDFDGDGLSDIVTMRIVTNPQGVFYLDDLKLYRKVEKSGAPFEIHTLPLPNGFLAGVTGAKHWIVAADFRGSGRMSYLLFLNSHNQTQGKKVFIGENATGVWTCNPLEPDISLGIPVTLWQNVEKIEVLDFDGDGKDELLLVRDNYFEIFSISGNHINSLYKHPSLDPDEKILPGDFNGDGKSDFILFNRTNLKMTLCTSTGKGVVRKTILIKPSWPAEVTVNGTNIVKVGDFNGDGKSDFSYDWDRIQYVTLPKEAYTYVYSGNDLYYSTGDAFAYQQVELESYVEGPYEPGIATAKGVMPVYIEQTPVDLNGDGRTDLFSVFGKTMYSRIYNSNGVENKLVKLKTGLGYEFEWQYVNSVANNDFFSNDGFTSQLPFVTRNPVSMLVGETREPSGNGEKRIAMYRYFGATFHTGGKGFLGFLKRTTDDRATGIIRTDEDILNSFYHTTIPSKTTISQTNSNPVSVSSYVFDLKNAGTKRYWPANTSETQSDNVRNITKTVLRTFDSYGNLTKSIESIPGVLETVTNTDYEEFGGRIPDKPTLISVTATRQQEAPFSVNTALQYNLIGQVIRKTDHLGTNNPLVSTYQYDIFGNLRSTTVSDGTSNRDTSTEFDAKGRFPIANSDEMGYKTYAGYDNRWGVPTFRKDLDDLSTTFRYDGFGKLRETLLPDGSTLKESQRWSSGGESKWIQETNESGQPNSRLHYDELGRVVRQEKEGFAGEWVRKLMNYDKRGNLGSETSWHRSGDNFELTKYQFDELGRSASVERGTLGINLFSYAPSGGKQIITSKSGNSTVARTFDATGMLISANDEDEELSYYYYSHGGLKKVVSGSKVIMEFEFDDAGRQIGLTEPNAGTTQYRYDAFGQLVWQKDSGGNERFLEYNSGGQLVSREGPEGKTTLLYGTENNSDDRKGKLKLLTGPQNSEIVGYRYDNQGRLKQLDEKNELGTFHTRYSYNQNNEISTISYPSGLVLNYAYNQRGYLEYIRKDSELIYQALTVNVAGQVEQYKKGNQKISSVFYDRNFPVRYFTPGIQDLNFNWDFVRGNLAGRSDNLKGKSETFVYDAQDRLTQARIEGGREEIVSYQSNGNIDTKSGVGKFNYDTDRINAVSSIQSEIDMPVFRQEISYTTFSQPLRLKRKHDGMIDIQLDFQYGADFGRIKSEQRQNGIPVFTRYYFRSGVELNTSQDGQQFLHYINGPSGLVGIIESVNGSHKIHYTYTDHLGSIVAATDPSGNLQTEQSFDAWGRRRNPSNWSTTEPLPQPPSWLVRGYTGHEHMDEFGLINMNGRLYDPVRGRMLSPDNLVPDPTHPQDFNRFTYVRNNPLAYTDPDGEFWSAVIGGVSGGALYAGIHLAKEKSFRNWDWVGFGMSVGTGAMIGLGCSDCGAMKVAAKVAGAQVASQAPAIQVSVGDNLVLSAGIAMGSGSQGSTVGVRGAVSYKAGDFTMGVSYLYGYSQMNYGGSVGQLSEWSGTWGGGLGYFSNTWGVGLGTTNWGGTTGNRSGSLTVRYKEWGLTYENDGVPFGGWAGSGTDSYRSAALTINRGDFSAGTRIFTGYRNLKLVGGPEEGYPYGKVMNPEIHDHLFAPLFMGYKGHRLGWDHYKFGHAFQNWLAHGRLKPQNWIPWLQSPYRPNKPYGGYYPATNFFNSW